MPKFLEPHVILSIPKERWQGRVDMFSALEDFLDDDGCECDLDYRCKGHRIRDEFQWLCYPVQPRRAAKL